MGTWNYDQLRTHVGHKIVCVGYGEIDYDLNSETLWNVAVECETCGCVLFDYDHPEAEEEKQPMWIDSHSVNCIKCSKLFDERNGLTPEDNEGTICPECMGKENE